MDLSGSPSRRSPRLLERDRSRHFVTKHRGTSSSQLSRQTARDTKYDAKENRPHNNISRRNNEMKPAMSAAFRPKNAVEKIRNKKRKGTTSDATGTAATTRTISSVKGKEPMMIPVRNGPPGTQFNWKDTEKYLKKLKSSQGFDVPQCVGLSGGDCITPLHLPNQLEDPFFCNCGREAVKLHNRNAEDEADDPEDKIIFQVVGIDRNKVKLKGQCGKVEFSKLIKMNANRQGYMFITMECKDLDDEGKIKQYQSILENLPQPDAFRLKMFRLKPSKESTSFGSTH